MPDTPRVLVTGGSVAGAAAAFWLARTGHEVTVLERAEQFREGGQNIDVRGSAHEVLRRMGLEDAVRERGTGEVGTRFVDEDGATVSELVAEPGEDGPTAELEILRGDLAHVLADACPDSVTWRFGDEVSGVSQDEEGVEVVYAGGSSERFDLLVVAEGVRSRTRELVFAGEASLDRLGMVCAYGTIPRSEDDDRWWQWLVVPGGVQAGLRPDNHGTTRAMLNYLSDDPGDLGADAQREQLRERFAGVGWEVPRILAGFEQSEDLYVDDLTQVRLPVWHRGRVCLLGDAAWCVTPIGRGGTSLAILGAYVLAAELSKAVSSSAEPSRPEAPGPGAHEAAFTAYEGFMRPVVRAAQDLPPGVPGLAAPRSRVGAALFKLGAKVMATGPAQRLASRATQGPVAEQELPELVERPAE